MSALKEYLLATVACNRAANDDTLSEEETNRIINENYPKLDKLFPKLSSIELIRFNEIMADANDYLVKVLEKAVEEME